MAEIIDFNIELINQEIALNLVEDAILYAAQITQNRLIDSSINSPFRFLLEAQIFVYGKILDTLSLANNELEDGLYRMLGYQIADNSFSKVLLKFELLQSYALPVYVFKAYPVSSTGGLLFLTEEILTIAPNSKIGYVFATCATSGEAGNVEAYTINNPRQLLSFNVMVTNESSAAGGSSKESLVSAQRELALAISNTTIVNAANYQYQLEKLNPNYFCNVVTVSSFNLSIYLGKKDGGTVQDNELIEVQNLFNRIKYIGLENIQVFRMSITSLFIEVVLSVSDPYSFTESRAIADTIHNLFINSKTFKGVVILEQIKRAITSYSFDYLQTARIGTSVNNAAGNNFVYNANTENVNASQVRVTLINDTVSLSQDFNYV